MANDKTIKIRTVFMGTSEFSESVLSSLLENQYNIVSVYTRPDKKVGRKQEIQKSPVKIIAEKNNLPIFEPKKFDEAVISELKKQKPDLIVVVAYGKILPKAVLEIPGFGAINIHASLLPKYRGPSPIQNSILNGEEKTGTTIMLMDKDVDTGDILSQQETAIGKNETSFDLFKRLSRISAELLLKTVPLWVERKISPTKQDGAKATLCQLIEREDGKIQWTDEAESIYNRWRAFFPWPGIYTFWEHNGVLKRIKLNKIDRLKNNPEVKHHIGEVFQIGDKFGVQTVSGIVTLEEVQLEGKDNLLIDDFINGYPNFIGSILK
jgi:methionyl-tRNA formyltransferase